MKIDELFTVFICLLHQVEPPNSTLTLFLLVSPFCVLQEELRAQLPRYQRTIPHQGQATAAAPSVGPVGGMMAPQPSMRHPIPGMYIRKSLHIVRLELLC